MYYKAVSEYVNSHNLRGRIVYHRYEASSSLIGFQNPPANCLLNKLEFNKKSPYSNWVEDAIADHYNYVCVSDMEEFYRYSEKAVTIEGLIKSVHNKHEKDDRPKANSRENYVLGWDNKEKIASIRTIVKDLQNQQAQNKEAIRKIDTEIDAIEKRKLCFHDIIEKYTNYDEINWEEIIRTIQEKEDKKKARQGETLEFKVIEFSKENKKIILSHTRIFQDAAEGDHAKSENDEAKKERATKKTVKKINETLEKTTLGDLSVLANLKEELDKEQKSE